MTPHPHNSDHGAAAAVESDCVGASPSFSGVFPAAAEVTSPNPIE